MWSQPHSCCDPWHIIHLWLCLFYDPVQSSFVPAFLCNFWPFPLTLSPYTRCLWFCKPKLHNTVSYICLTCSCTPVAGLCFIFLFSALHPLGICTHITVFTPSPLLLPVVLLPDNTIPLCLPCLSPPKLRTTLFLSESTTHKLKPSPYPYAAVFHNLYTALCAPHSTPLTSPLQLLGSGVALTLSLSFHLHIHSFPHFLTTPAPS